MFMFFSKRRSIMSKLITIVCALTLALSTISYAVDPILVGNWEHSYDSWTIAWDGSLAGFAADGATLNSNALKLVVAPGSWGEALQLKLQGPSGGDLNNYNAQSMLPMLFPGQGDHAYTGSPWNMFECDITVLSTEWIDDGNPDTEAYLAMKLVLNTGGQNADGEYGTGVWYDAGDIVLPLDATTHAVWDISAGIADTIAHWNECYTASDQYYELFLLPMNTGYIGGLAGLGTYHIDAAYLTPEPATIALLGLGALSLIRRKR
jgi:hypothetical protein